MSWIGYFTSRHNVKLLLVLFLPHFLFENTYSFNLDIETAHTFRGGQTNSYFGYSVALHRSTYGNAVLIGAPRANTSALLLDSIVNGGALYRCFVRKYVHR